MKRNYLLYAFYFILTFSYSVNVYSIRMRMKDYNVNISEMSYMGLFPVLPWFFKCIFGWISDSFGFFGYHRKPYIIMSTFLCAVCCWLLFLKNLSLMQFLTLLFFLNLFSVWYDDMINAMMVEDSRNESVENSGRLQIHIKRFKSLGRILGTIGPTLYDEIGDEGIYGIMSALFLIAMVLGVVVQDTKRPAQVEDTTVVKSIELDSKGNNLNQEPDEEPINYGCCFQLGHVKESFQNPILRKLLIFTLFLACIPSPALPIFFFLTDELQYSGLQMSFLSLAAEFGRLIGLWIYDRFFRKFRIRSILVFLCAFNLLLSLVPLALTTIVHLAPGETCNSDYGNNTNCYYFEQQRIDPMPLSMSDDVMTDVIDELRSLPLERITSIICSSAVEATVFASMLSMQNMMSAMSGLIDAFFIRLFELDHGKYDNLSALIKFCSMFNILSVLFALLLPKETTQMVYEEVKTQRATTTDVAPIVFRNIGAMESSSSEEHVI